MKNATLISICLGSVLAFTAPLTLAEDAKSQPGQMVKVLDNLKEKGYIIIKKIGFDKEKGNYKAKVVNAQGKNIEIQINPESGEMIKPKGEMEGMTAIEIAKKVQDGGYTNIDEINTEILGDHYDVKIVDDKGNKLSLKVDAKSGNITK